MVAEIILFPKDHLVSNFNQLLLSIVIDLGYKIMLANMEITEESEHYMYDFESFVSEFGGSLGLFLGFSFFTLWDFGAPLLVVIKKAIRKTI